ncbi:MAG: serine/threonine protein kinase [Acidobacteriota bacterium]
MDVRTPLQVGDIVDQFVIKEKLHLGGMATLWGVRQLDDLGQETGPLLIMKVPRIKGGQDPATIVGFEVEQMVMPMLQGPHVPRFIARGDFTSQPYIVMEQIQGESLRPRLDHAPLPFDEVAQIGHKVAFALHALHKQHVVHLDIKPSNIMFRATGEAVLVDFGLSRHDKLPDLLEEEFNLPMGTGPYISPEQVQFVRNDPRSDLFALGVMLYHLTTGERPFGQPNTVAGLRKRLYTEPIPPRQIRPETPAWLQEVILHCLEVQPDRRYQTAAQLASDLLNPQQIQLTERADKRGTAGKIKTLRRWFAAMGADPKSDASAAEQVEHSPTILAAVDTRGAAPELQHKLLATVRRILQIEPGARLACISVMKTARVGMDKLTDRHGNSLHVKQLVDLKHWARPLEQSLGLDDQRLTFHVLEAPDAAQAIVEFANKNQVDHIVMGARGASAIRRYLGSVSARVVAEAECSVTVVRV